MSSPGTLIAGRYRLNKLLGEGGMGTVWHATNERIQRDVALKLLKVDAPADGADPEQIRAAWMRALKEARAACAVPHPNVVEVFDVPDDGDVPFLVMELLEGESLRQRLDRCGKLDIAEACALFVQVASALGAVHDKGIIHRDLKPANIFLAAGPGGGAPRVKVLDFGIAKVVHRPGSMATETVTRNKGLIGSLPYMSPEQAGGEQLDHRTDIWSLGISLYECMTGVLPTAGDNTGQVLRRIFRLDFRPIEELLPAVPAGLARLIGRMLAERPSERPADLRAVMDELALYAQAPPAALPAPVPGPLDSTSGYEIAPRDEAPSSPPPPPVPPTKPRRLGSIMALSLLLAIPASLVVGGAIGGLSSDGPGTDSKTPPGNSYQVASPTTRPDVSSPGASATASDGAAAATARSGADVSTTAAPGAPTPPSKTQTPITAPPRTQPTSTGPIASPGPESPVSAPSPVNTSKAAGDGPSSAAEPASTATAPATPADSASKPVGSPASTLEKWPRPASSVDPGKVSK